MVKHIVLWTVKEEFDKERAFNEINERFEQFVGSVPGLLSYSLHLGFQGYDICLETEHESKEALDLYQEHPDHAAIKTIVASYRDLRASCDFIVED